MKFGGKDCVHFVFCNTLHSSYLLTTSQRETDGLRRLWYWFVKWKMNGERDANIRNSLWNGATICKTHLCFTLDKAHGQPQVCRLNQNKHILFQANVRRLSWTKVSGLGRWWKLFAFWGCTPFIPRSLRFPVTICGSPFLNLNYLLFQTNCS